MIYLLSPWCERKYSGPITSLLYLKYYLQDNGIDSEVIDCSQYDKDYNEVMAKIIHPDVIGITGYTRERFNAYSLIWILRERFPEATFVVGGRHFGALADEVLSKLPVDHVVKGEGEEQFIDICRRHYRNQRTVNIDKYRCFDQIDSGNLTTKLKLAAGDFVSVTTSRGCVGQCVFCCDGPTIIRFRSIAKIVTEIEQKIRLTGCQNVAFGDSAFTVLGPRVVELCYHLKKLGVRWSCYARADMDPGLIPLMAESGCVEMDIGLESGSTKVLKAIKKRIKVDDYRRLVKEAHLRDIKTYVFVMISLPDETWEDALETLELVRETSDSIDGLGVQVARIMPDAALYQIAKDRGLLPEGFDWFKPYKITKEEKEVAKDWTYQNVPLYREHLSLEQIATLLKTYELIVLKKMGWDGLKQAIRWNLKWDVFKRLTPNKAIDKVKKLWQIS